MRLRATSPEGTKHSLANFPRSYNQQEGGEKKKHFLKGRQLPSCGHLPLSTMLGALPKTALGRWHQ